ncbi:MAG TPA: glycine betaine ABC transporter substrate-binding protein [Acidimicrobiales bacterium]|nr:glycine betaine ABC transporter substrate-binding protein [Acidimicrobiales bacterium]
MNSMKGLRGWRARIGIAATAVASLGLALAAVGGAPAGASASKPTITLATNSWEGSLSNNVVAQYVIEHDLHYPVNLLTIDEIPTWPAMAQGKVSAVMEVWGHSPLYQQYVKGNHQVLDAGLEGPDGNIGWYVPTYLIKAHPELATWQGLKKDWKLFVTPQSSPKGEFLDGSPSYVTNDAALVNTLGLNLKVVYAGTEAAQLAQIERIYKAHGAVLFYWYTPQYINALYKFSEIKLPPFTQACAKLAAAKINCAYPPYYLYKAMSAQLPKTAPAVASFIKRFHWTSDDQNAVGYDMAVKNMSQTAAAAAFVKSHKALVQSWLSGPSTKTLAPVAGT